VLPRAEILGSSSQAKIIKTHPGAAGSPVPVTSHRPLPGLDVCVPFSPFLLAARAVPSQGGGCWRTHPVQQLPRCPKPQRGTPARQHCTSPPSQAVTFVLSSCSSPHISAGFLSSACDLLPGQADVPKRGPQGGCSMSLFGVGNQGWGRGRQPPPSEPHFISLQGPGKTK